MKKYESTGNRFYKYERLERRIQQEYGVTEAKKLGWAKNKLSKVISNINKNKNKNTKTKIDKLSAEMKDLRESLIELKQKKSNTTTNLNTRAQFTSKTQPLKRYVDSRGGFLASLFRKIKSFYRTLLIKLKVA